jgi:hypothetical protein
VLEEGLPNVRLFGASKFKGIPIYPEEKSPPQIVSKINKTLKKDLSITFSNKDHMYLSSKNNKQQQNETINYKDEL